MTRNLMMIINFYVSYSELVVNKLGLQEDADLREMSAKFQYSNCFSFISLLSPHLSSGPVHLYQLDESISTFMGV